MKRQPPRYFNNCRSRPHAEIYGSDNAFFDLNRFGKQATMATNLEVGEKCIVATQNEMRDTVEFVEYSFIRETIKPDEKRVPTRVQYGKRLRSKTMSKVDAAKSKQYGVFFNVNGDFKRPSVIVP